MYLPDDGSLGNGVFLFLVVLLSVLKQNVHGIALWLAKYFSLNLWNRNCEIVIQWHLL